MTRKDFSKTEIMQATKQNLLTRELAWLADLDLESLLNF